MTGSKAALDSFGTGVFVLKTCKKQELRFYFTVPGKLLWLTYIYRRWILSQKLEESVV